MEKVLQQKLYTIIGFSFDDASDVGLSNAS